MLTTSRLLHAAALSLALAAPAAAQCIGPDNLNGPCCAPVNDNLPHFQQASLPGLGVRWKHCMPFDKNDLKVVWAPPTQVHCGEYVTKLDVFDGTTGAPLLTGKLTLDYTRTWMEASPVATHQVWRLVAKADLMSVVPAGVPVPTPVPNCVPPLGPHPTCFWYGYVDYAAICGTTLFENVLVLFHGCDFLQHKPVFSSRPGVFHPDDALAIIAPHSTVQPFTPGNFPVFPGPHVAEAWREAINPAGPAFCTAEEKIVSGGLFPFIQGCLCPLSPVPPQVTFAVDSGTTGCVDAIGNPTAYASQFIAFPTLPWAHLVIHSLGNWANPVIYPGQEVAQVAEGLYRTHAACTGQDAYEVFYGSYTTKGLPIVQPTTGLTDRFLDLADNYTAKNPGPVVLPILGNVMPTDHMIYTNQ